MKREDFIKYDEKLPVSEKISKETAAKNHRPKINQKLCQKSYNCAVFCPAGAIEILKSGLPSINYDICNGCLICLRECPHSAITEESE
jgi:pyruvate ferredoxin oxidoreductase gamma subunit